MRILPGSAEYASATPLTPGSVQDVVFELAINRIIVISFSAVSANDRYLFNSR